MDSMETSEKTKVFAKQNSANTNRGGEQSRSIGRLTRTGADNRNVVLIAAERMNIVMGPFQR